MRWTGQGPPRAVPVMVMKKLKPLRKVCAWCQAVVVDGPREGPVSHGICAECFEHQLVPI